MPLLDCFKRLVDWAGRHHYRGQQAVYVCGLQHILPSQEQLFGAIHESQIARGCPIIIGKHYSTVRHAFPPEHYLVHDIPDITYKRGSFEATFRAQLKSFCERLENTVTDGERRPVIILDDGGYVAEFLVEKFLKHRCHVVVIEQTTSGLKSARKYPCPVVPVASSILKREVESIFIADSIVKALGRRRILIRPGLNCGVIGFGAVGAALCRALKKLGVKTVSIFDLDSGRRTAAANEGFAVLQNANLCVEQSELLFGCTGEDVGKMTEPSSVRRNEKELLCVSCGSSDGEFASWMSAKGLARLYRRRGRIGGNGFDDVEGRFGSGSFRVLNGGFPINLDRSVMSDPVDDFVLTRMLVFCGILQAITLVGTSWANENRIVPLHKDLERAVHDVWFDVYPKRLSQDVRARAATLLGLPQQKSDR